MTALAVVPKPSALDAAIELALDAVSSPETKKQYRRALAEFLGWRAAWGLPFDRASVHKWRAGLEKRGLSPSTINVRLSAVRKLAREAQLNGYLDAQAAAAIDQVGNVRQTGSRAGNWLTLAQVQKLVQAPEPATLKGKRDRCALALLAGCALRRSEAANLTFEHIQQREGRWAIVDMRGKRGRIRTVAVPAWVKAAIDRWSEAAQISTGRVLRAMYKGDRIGGESLSGVAILNLAAQYGEEIGVALQAHDLRRTCAKLCRKHGGALEQIQLLLGHESVQTTERYLGTTLDLEDAPNDQWGVKWREE
jgi:integrase